MTRPLRWLTWATVAWIVAMACGPLQAQSPPTAGGYQWQLPTGFPEPKVPADNPMSVEKVALGRHLFYDRRLSIDQTFSCATCHQQSRAFADDKARGHRRDR